VKLRAALDRDIQMQNKHLWDSFVHCDKQGEQKESFEPPKIGDSFGERDDILIGDLRRTVDEQNFDIDQKQKQIDKLKKQLEEQKFIHEVEIKNLRANIIGNENIDGGIVAPKEKDISRGDQGHFENEETNYNPSKIMFLNISNPTVLRDFNPPVRRRETTANYSIDILSIGSIHSIKRAETQMKTWGSHVSRRHFWLATEFDDPDPTCHTSMTAEDLKDICHTCRKLGVKYWTEKNAVNDLTMNFHNLFAQEQWLNKKKNPTGWLCAQKRFVTALSKLMAMYREAKDVFGVDLPDYLIFGDDDTYVNLEMFEEELLRNPQEEVKQKNLTLQDELSMVYPTQNTPVVWAGCRVRRPTSLLHDTIPFGGFGVMFSKAAIERMIQPLYCNDTSTGFEWEACEHWTPAYQNFSIGEFEHFRPGMSVSDLMGNYTKNVSPFCLHSDWAVGYFVNYFNISRHVVPTGHLHPDKAENDKIYWYNDQMGDVKQARLHAWHDGSELYKQEEGNCRKIHRRCDEKSGLCHQMDEHRMKSVHQKVTNLFPTKYRYLQ